MLHSLHARLTLVFLVILLVLGVSSLWLARAGASQRSLEDAQRLNAPVARYMVETTVFADEGGLRGEALAELAPHVMTINPSVAVYLLDADGEVVAQASTMNTIAPRRVDLAPVRRFLQPDVTYPLLGDDPLGETPAPFSAWPVRRDGRIVGYVYAVLGGRGAETLGEALNASRATRELSLTLGAAVLFAALAGALVFFTMTRRLRALARRVERDPLRHVAIPPEPSGPLESPDPRSTDADTPVRPPCAPRTVDSRPGARGTSPSASARARGRRRRARGGPSPSAEAASGATRTARRRDEIDELAHVYDTMTERLRGQYARLAESDAERRELIAAVSHDLRTPLTALAGYLETLELDDDSLGPAARRHCLDIAHRHARVLRARVDELFELSRLSAPATRPRSERFPLRELAHDCLQDFVPLADERGVSLGVEVEGGDVSDGFPIDADIALVQRLLENLVGNALRHTDPGDRVRVTLSRPGRRWLRLEVLDDGHGMTAAVAERAFDACFSGTSTESREHGGLGLAIVDRIVALHGGRLALHSREGVGSRFTIDLPAPDPDGLPAAAVGFAGGGLSGCE